MITKKSGNLILKGTEDLGVPGASNRNAFAARRCQKIFSVPSGRSAGQRQAVFDHPLIPMLTQKEVRRTRFYPRGRGTSLDGSRYSRRARGATGIKLRPVLQANQNASKGLTI
jgi:hypothetical protein